MEIEKPKIKAGWRVGDWCDEAGIGRSTYYALPDELAPASVRINSMRIIVEQPPDWLRRVGTPQRKEAA